MHKKYIKDFLLFFSGLFYLIFLLLFLYTIMKELLSIFLGGEQRVVLPALLYPVIIPIPSSLLALLVIIPNDKLSSKVKQILSIPLLVAVFFLPFGFTMGNRGNF